MSTRIAALSTVLALFLEGCTTNNSNNLDHKLSFVPPSQSSFSVSEESDDSQEELDKKEEENRTSVYGVLSGNPNGYHFAYNTNNTKRILDQYVETKVGLTREEIKELTHRFTGEYNYFKAGLIRDYLDTLPSLDKFELSELLEDEVDRQFINYAITIGYTSFDDVMALKYFFEANGATTQQVGSFTLELDAPPLPDELVDAGLRAGWYNGRTFNEFWAKGYPLEEIVTLSQIHVTGSTFNDFETIGLVDVHTIKGIIAKYGKDIAKTMRDAGLSVMDLPFVEEVGKFDIEQYVKAGIKGRDDIARLSKHVSGADANLYAQAGFKGADAISLPEHADKNVDSMISLSEQVNISDANFYALAGFKGDADSMIFLADNHVNGELAFVYSRKGITNKRAMVVLQKAGVDESAFANMQLFGFLDSKRFDYNLAELLVANSVYQQYKPLLEQALPDGVGLPKIGLKDDEKRKLPLDYSRIPSYNRSNGLLEITE